MQYFSILIQYAKSISLKGFEIINQIVFNFPPLKLDFTFYLIRIEKLVDFLRS